MEYREQIPIYQCEKRNVIVFTLEEVKKDSQEIEPFETCFIFSREHGLFWGPKSSGYTKYVNKAGRYKVQEAIKNTHHCGPEKGIEYWFIQ